MEFMDFRHGICFDSYSLHAIHRKFLHMGSLRTGIILVCIFPEPKLLGVCFAFVGVGAAYFQCPMPCFQFSYPEKWASQWASSTCLLYFHKSLQHWEG